MRAGMSGHEDGSNVYLRPDGIEIQGLRVPLRSAGFPYWEVEPRCWERALDSARELRLRLLRVDIPWALHERAPDVYDWGGQRPELDLGHLLTLAHERGLFVLVRPGPWLGRSFPDAGGLPVRVMALPGVQALDAGGVRWPVPALASERLLEESRAWLEAVATFLAPHLYPLGPVVASISGAPGPVPSRWGGGALDRSRDALALYSRFVEVKYPAAIAPIGFPPLSGPTRPEELERCMAWVEAGELAQRRLVPRLVPCNPDEEHAAPLPVLMAVCDPSVGAGGDAWACAGDADALTLGFADDAATDFGLLRLLGLRAAELVPSGGVLELPAGGSLLCPRPLFDPPSTAAVLAMSGVRALDLDTLVPRAHLAEVEAPLDQEGRAHTRVGSRWRALFRLLDAIDHPSCRRRSDCLLLANRELARVREACASTGLLPLGLAPARDLDALRIQTRELGLGDRPERDHDVLFQGLFDGLRASGTAFSVTDTSIPLERLADWRVLVLVSFERMSRALAQRVFGWVAEGGTLVIGPRLPTHDWVGTGLGLRWPDHVKTRLTQVRLGQLVLEGVDLMTGADAALECEAGVLATHFPFEAGRIIHFGFRLPWHSAERDPRSLVQIVRGLLGTAGVEPCYPASHPHVETELFETEDRRFLFLANPGLEACSVTLETAAREALREIRGEGRHLRAGEPLSLAPTSILLREVVRL